MKKNCKFLLSFSLPIVVLFYFLFEIFYHFDMFLACNFIKLVLIFFLVFCSVFFFILEFIDIPLDDKKIDNIEKGDKK